MELWTRQIYSFRQQLLWSLSDPRQKVQGKVPDLRRPNLGEFVFTTLVPNTFSHGTQEGL